MRFDRTATSIIFLFIAAYLINFSLSLEKLSSSATEETAKAAEGIVTRVVDGHTIVVSGFGSVRLIGVDTPETAQPDKAVECMGPEAAEFTRKATLENKVGLKGDPLAGEDPHGRVLAYVFLPDGTLLNKELLRQGYGRITKFHYQRKREFLEAQREARSKGLGGWRECGWR